MSSIINATLSNGLSTSADNSGEIELQSNGTTALKVNTNEGIQILNCLGVGNATPSTSGAGITFPATQSASSDANTLDDYEEGTWTPTITAGFTSPTYSVQQGRYTKVGRICYFNVYLTVNGGTRNASGVTFSLPFTANITSNTYAGGGYWVYASGGVINSTSTNLPTLYIGSGEANLAFYKTDGGTFIGNDLNNAVPSIYFIGWYEAA